MNKELTDKKKTNLFCKLKCLNSKKTSSRLLKRIVGNNNKSYSGNDDHYTMNVGGQKPKICRNCLLKDPYLQCCLHYVISTRRNQIIILLGSSSRFNKGRQLFRKYQASFKHYLTICDLSFNVQYNLNYLYFREIKRPSEQLDSHYNQEFNYNIQNCCWHLCSDDM